MQDFVHQQYDGFWDGSKDHKVEVSGWRFRIAGRLRGSQKIQT